MTQYDGMPHTELRVVETSDMPDDMTTDGGAIEIEPGAGEDIVRWRTNADRFKIHGYGANDELNANWTLHVDGEVCLSTEAPLGSMVDPFSFEQMYGRPISGERRFELRVTNFSDEVKEFVGKVFLREVNLPQGVESLGEARTRIRQGEL